MDIDNLNSIESSLRSLKLSAVEKFIDNYKQNGDVLFANFEGHCDIRPEDLDITKSVPRHGLRFSRVTQKLNG